MQEQGRFVQQPFRRLDPLDDDTVGIFHQLEVLFGGQLPTGVDDDRTPDPGLLAVHKDATGHAKADALAYGKGIGCTRAGVIETTFEEETETDLFGEQAVLCGGVSALVKAGFQTLVDAGYQPEIAYFECMHELKLIVDLMYRGGLNYMRHSVSDTAEHGDYTGGPRLITDSTREEMKRMLEEIRNGAYADKWIKENETGRPWFNEQRSGERSQLLEQVGARLRTMMPFLDAVEGRADVLCTIEEAARTLGVTLAALHGAEGQDERGVDRPPRPALQPGARGDEREGDEEDAGGDLGHSGSRGRRRLAGRPGQYIGPAAAQRPARSLMRGWGAATPRP